MLDGFLTVEITLYKMATHLTGATKGLVFKRKQARRAITLPNKLAKLKNVESTKDKVGYLRGIGSGNGDRANRQPAGILAAACCGASSGTVREVHNGWNYRISPAGIFLPLSSHGYYCFMYRNESH